MKKKKQQKSQKSMRDNKTAKAVNTKKRRKKRRGKYTLHYILIAIFALAAGIALSLTVFFKIEAITVAGNTKYLQEQIIESTGIKIEDNLFRVKRSEIEERLKKQYTYIEEVKLRYRLPPTILVDIKEAKEMSLAKVDEARYAIISDKGKILDIKEGTPIGDEPLVVGINLLGVVEGDFIDKKNEEEIRVLKYLVTALEATSFTGATKIDISDRLNIRIVYENRILIGLGTEGELEYKLRFVKHALESSVEEKFEGVIDASIPKEVRIRAVKLDENHKPLEEAPPNQVDTSEGGDASIKTGANGSSSSSTSSTSTSSSSTSSTSTSSSSTSSSSTSSSSTSSASTSSASSSGSSSTKGENSSSSSSAKKGKNSSSSSTKSGSGSEGSGSGGENFGSQQSATQKPNKDITYG